LDSFAKRFKQLRSEMMFTQDELLDKFNKIYHRNYKSSAISFYENGKRIPEIDALKDFADFFGVSVSYLLGESDVRTPDKDRYFNKIVEKIKQLSPADREKAEEYIDMLQKLSDIESSANIIDMKKNA